MILLLIRKYLLIFSGTALMALNFTSCSGDANPSATPNNAESKVTLRIVCRAEFTDAEASEFPVDFFEKSLLAGWNRVDGGMEKEGPGSNVVITNGISSATTDENGEASLPEGNLTNLRMIIGEHTVALPDVSKHTTSAGTSNVVRYIQPAMSCHVDETCTDDCCTDTTTESTSEHNHETSAQVGPMDGRCNDYNGWFSDGINYPHSEFAKSLRNFIMSDCDRAFFQAECWRDHIVGGCWLVHGAGGCSRVLRHSWSYHKHNFPN